MKELTTSEKKADAKCSRVIWKKYEDDLLLEIVKKEGRKNWGRVTEIFEELLPRSEKTAKQCRERYRNYLNPKFHLKDWSEEDELLMLVIHNTYGNKWEPISSFYQGRSDVSLKNLFYSCFRRSLNYLKQNEPISHCDGKLFKQLYILDIVERYYIPLLSCKGTPNDKPTFDSQKRNGGSQKVLLKLVSHMKITKELIETYRGVILGQISAKNLPFEVEIDLRKWTIPPQKVNELDAIVNAMNAGPLAKLIKAKVLNPVEIVPPPMITSNPIPTQQFVLTPAPAPIPCNMVRVLVPLSLPNAHFNTGFNPFPPTYIAPYAIPQFRPLVATFPTYMCPQYKYMNPLANIK